MLNVFKPDEEFLKNEKNYETIKKEILGNQKFYILEIYKFQVKAMMTILIVPRPHPRQTLIRIRMMMVLMQ